MIKPVDYKQNDWKWGSLPYAVDGERSTVKSAGCGPTVMADVLASLVSPYYDPITTASWARHSKHNYKVKNNGTSYSYFVPQGEAYGVKVVRLNTSNVYGKTTHAVHKKVLNELLKGNWIIACMGKGLWTRSGHYVLVYGYANGNVYINDPASKSAKRACNTWELFKSQVKYYWVVEVPEDIKKNGIVVDGAYDQDDFVRETQFCTGSGVDEIPGKQTLGNTPTISAKKNRKHAVVLPLQKKLRKLKMYFNKFDRIAGSDFTEGTNTYQTQILNYPKGDGEITGKGKMWRSLLGM